MPNVKRGQSEISGEPVFDLDNGPTEQILFGHGGKSDGFLVREAPQ